MIPHHRFLNPESRSTEPNPGPKRNPFNKNKNKKILFNKQEKHEIKRVEVFTVL